MKKNGKYCNSKKGLNMKPLAVLLALTLLVGCAVGGTLAWLLDTSDTVVNTFTDSDINITLSETKPVSKTAKMVPGWTIAKDPKVTIAAGSEDCYVFIKIEKSANYDTYLEDYVVNDGWLQLKTDDATPVAVAGVFYQKLQSVSSEWNANVLKGEGTGENVDGYVTVKNTVTKDQMNALNAQGATNPTLKFTAYASQLMKNNTDEFTPYEAWTNLNPATP